MSKKAIIITIVSIAAFLLVSVGSFYASYTVMGKMMQIGLEDYAEEDGDGILSKETLEGIADEELEYEIVNNIWYYVIGDDYENEYELVTELPQSSQYLYATNVFENQFYNGGFAQFFYSYSGDFTEEAIEGYKFFGAKQHANLLTRAAELYEKEQALFEAADADESSNAFYKLYKQSEMSKLDEEFEKLTEDAAAMKIKYIRSHLDEFVTE